VTRLLSGIALLAVVLAALLWLPPWGTAVVAALAAMPAAWELCDLAEQKSGPLPRWIVAIATVSVVLAMAPRWFPPEVPLLAALLVMGCVLVGEGRVESDVLRRAGAMLFPMLYVGLPLGAMAAIRYDRGAIALLLLLATTVVSDTAQYYGGRAFGRRPLAPRISPKKTVEGAVSGIVVGSLVLPLGGAAVLTGTPIWLLWVIGLALVGLGIVGDLFESLLKRSVGVKDSSALIPGHGGVLDRIDSLLFAAPFYYGFLRTL
jgi:phosphatidate cytidylyltransferase